jgi:hypothetical protein
VTIAGKSLSLLGEGGELRGFTLAISGLQPHQAVHVDRLRLGATQTLLELTNCRGHVHLNQIYSSYVNLQATACDQITVRATDLRDSSFDRCHAVLEDVRIYGTRAVTGEEALVIANGSMQMVTCRVHGSAGFGFPLAAVRLNHADLRVLGSSTLSGGAGMFQQTAPAVVGIGTMRNDPAVQVHGAAPAISGSVTHRTIPMPMLDRTDGGLGDTITASLRGPSGNPGIVLIGLSAAPYLVPGIADTLWFEPAASFAQAIGIPQQGAPLSASLAIPNQAGFLGHRIVWQAIAYDNVSGYQVSNPSHLVVRNQ